MAKFYVSVRWDATVYGHTVIDAETPEEAEAAALRQVNDPSPLGDCPFPDRFPKLTFPPGWQGIEIWGGSPAVDPDLSITATADAERVKVVEEIDPIRGNVRRMVEAD